MIKFRLLDENDDYKEYSINLNFKNFDDFYDWTEENSEEYDEFVENLEFEYGVHDFDGEEGVVGYTSYEIEDFTVVMNEWRNFWNKHNRII